MTVKRIDILPMQKYRLARRLTLYLHIPDVCLLRECWVADHSFCCGIHDCSRCRGDRYLASHYCPEVAGATDGVFTGNVGLYAGDTLDLPLVCSSSLKLSLC